MRSFHILDIKKFMSLLLLQEAFDSFLLQELEILTSHRMVLSGRRNEQWYSKEELEELAAMGQKKYISWKEAKEKAKNEIKGRRTPELINGVFYLEEEKVAALAAQSGMRREEVQALVWNLRFDKDELHIITAVSLNTFTMDKTLEQSWDVYMAELLAKCEVCYE